MRGWSAGLVLAAIAILTHPALAADPGPASQSPAPARWEALAETAFDHLDRKAGMIHDYVTTITQDRDGFIWVGTEGGLDRYDGYRFKSFKHDPDDPSSLPANFVLCLHVDPAGRLWVGTQSGGLARFDPATETFQPYPTGPGGISSTEVTGLADDGSGGLWISTWGGLDHLDGTSGAITAYRHDAADPDSLPSDQVLSVLRDAGGEVWAGTAAGLVRHIEGGTKFQAPEIATQVPAAALADRISSLGMDARGRIWVGTARSGVVRLDAEGKTAELAPEPPGGLRGAQINAIAEVMPGTMWFATDGSGLQSLHPETGATRLMRHNYAVPASLGDDHLTAIFRDRAGTIWVGTDSGLDRHDPATDAVATIYGGPGHPDGISDAQVTAVAAARNGLVWLGFAEQGVDVLDPATHRVAALRPDPNDAENALPRGSVNALAMAPDDSAWVGTDHGLYLADPTAKMVKLVRLEDHPAPFVRALLPLADDLWIGTQDGLLRYRPANKEITAYTADPGNQAGLSDGRVLALAADPAGAIWVGTEHGLNRLDPATGLIERIMPDPQDRSSLSIGTIATLTTDPAGRLWVGTIGGGIDILYGRDTTGKPMFRHLGARDGLPDPLVDAFLWDGQGRLWASTDNRLAMVDPKTVEIHPLLAAEGVRILSYWGQSAARTSKDELLFGGTGGLTVVRPELVKEQTEPPQIAVTGIRVGDRELPVAAFNRTGQATSITLKPGAKSFYVEFAGLDFGAAERERYEYLLEGFDEDWVDAPHRVATYTNLPPGDYRLRLRVQDRTAEWTEAVQPLTIHVLPSLYQKLWFRLLMAVVACLMVMLVIQARTAALRRRRAELQKLVDRRTAELLAANERLEALATTDGLTGVFNRRHFMEVASQEIVRALRSGHKLCVVMADLDHFKRVNDTHGHLAGDEVLRAVAQRFRIACRRIDTLARYGGEEFIILMPETGIEPASGACERLRASIADAPIEIEGGEVAITISVGLAEWTGETETLEKLIDRADKALYAAKSQGRNRVATAEPTLV